jgi:hypothetical protein
MEEFDALLRCFGWPQTPVVFQLVRHGVWLAEGEFRALLASDGDDGGGDRPR